MKRNRKTNRKETRSSLEAYLEHLTAAQIAAERIAQYLDDNGETSPDEITWAHVGSMQHLADELTQLKDWIDGTGEFAE